MPQTFDGLLNPAKQHLFNLPEEVFPAPDYPGESESGVMIIPLFLTRPNDGSLEHHIVKSAVWARRSWLMFTDAVDLDIPIKFYVERSVRKRALPLLQKYGIDTDKWVLYFDGKDTYGTPMNHLGHKLAFFNDKQFRGYDWVWQLDSDAFFASLDKTKFPFFEKSMKMPHNLTAIEYWKLAPEKTISDMHWHSFLLDDSYSDEQRTKEWISRAKSICDSGLVDKYLKPNNGMTGVSGGLYGFPAKKFLSEHKETCKWIENAGKVMQDDEAVFSLLIARGEEVTHLSDNIHIRSVADLNILNEGHRNHHISHFGRMDWEYNWRESFDAIKRSQNIDKWYYSNLDNRPEKVDAQELVSVIQGFPPNVLQRVPCALQNHEIPETMKEISDMMVADGFDEWHYDAIKENDREPVLLASDWTKLRILRQVIENGENAVITSDNAYLLCKFDELQEVVNQLPDDMNALYLHWEANTDYPDQIKALSRLEQSGVDGVLSGFNMIGWIVYFTQKGAKLFYDLWRQMPSADGQEVMYWARHHGLSDLQGFYCCNPQIASAVFNLHEIHGYTLSEDNALILKDKGKESFYADTQTLNNNRNALHTQRIKEVPKNKTYLSMLPPLKEPIPSYRDDSTDAIMLFPILEGGNNGLISDHIVQSAIWARRSWVLFSDAQDRRIPIKYYVDDSEIIRDDVMRVFEDNFVDVDNDVIWTDMSMYPSDKIFSKKHKVFNDDNLARYKWVYAMDSDLFLASKQRNKFPFFGKLSKHPLQIGVTEMEWDNRLMMCSHYFDETVEDIINNDVRGYSVAVSEWLESVLSMTSRLVYDKYLHKPGSIPITKMPIIAFPARHFLTSRKNDCEWWEVMGKLLGHDEETSAIWHAKNEPLWSIMDELEIPINWWHVHDYPYHEDFYISHPATTGWEHKFREDIDAV